MTTPEIRELDAQTVERIAAGEVVERPASAVKELLENSLDADASRVTVAVESGGADLIRVTDDGVGMDEETLCRAVEKHTTSKIRDIDDLEGGVGTLGFRGEALHAIGSVSRTTLRSRPRDGGRGTELVVEGGEVTAVSPAGCPAGTTVEVEDLFYNVPARRKYLKTESTEFSHVSTVVTNYALANPDVSVTLEHDGRETFATTGSGSLRETVLSVYGREVAESMVSVALGDDTAEGPLTELSGLVSHPETNRASREYLSTFVNGRYVTASTVREAIVDAYGDQLAADRYPFAVLFLAVDPATVDVNVHPRKLEVRFADEEGVREQVRSAVESGLLDEGLVRSSAPRGKSAPRQAEIRPGDPPQEDTGEQAELAGGASGGESETDESAESPPTDPTGDDATPDGPGGGTTEGETANPADTGRAKHPSQAEGAPSPASESDAETDNTPESPGSPATISGSAGVSGPSGSGPGESADEAGKTGTVRPERDSPGPDGDRKFRGGGQQARLGQGDADIGFEQLPGMRVIGQFRDTYIVAETEDGLVLVDQHAADERINYERLQASVADGTTTQALAEPVRLEVTAREAELFDAHDDALARLGFHASLVEDRVVEVSTVPALVAETAGPELVRDVLGEFVEGDIAAAATVEAAVDELLADLACYPSITGNTSLTEGSVLDLLDALDDCENPYACPHGRPVVVELDDGEIDARFERDYPGHG